MSPPPAIGVFDSGVGGLSVLREIRPLIPHAPLLYAADQAHVPYGGRPAPEIQQLSTTLTRFLLSRNAQIIVVACNTATAAAIDHLREAFPAVPFVGMEPALKPAVQKTHSGVIGVLATANTFQSQRYANLAARFAADVQLLQNPCVGLVERIERGETDTPETEQFLRAIVEPMLAQGADTLILGCTHYPFVRPLLEKIAGSHIAIIDPATAVARQVQRLLPFTTNQPEMPPQFYTTGDEIRLHHQVRQLLGWEEFSVMKVEGRMQKSE